MISSTAILALLTAAEALTYGPFGTPEKPYTQETVDDKTLLKYTGWQGPYSNRRGFGINRDPPAGTKVDQVVQLMRHGERWPDAYDYKAQAATLEKVFKYKGSLNGSIAFANNWEPFTSTESGWLSEESLMGPYSGLNHAYNFGAQSRRRYFELYDGQSILPIFSSGYERIVDTARKFGEGFLQWNYTTLGALNIIQETRDQGANSLVPVCDPETKNKTFCPVPEHTDQVGAPWVYPQYGVAAERLIAENPSLNLTAGDIPQLLAVAAFELNIRGNSPWADVFTSEEWIAFEYAQSSYYYCFYGPGSVTGPSQGSLFLNATRTLLLQGPQEALPLYFSFAHDTDIIHLLAAMNFEAVDYWNATEVQFGQRWDVTDLTPQGSHIVFERLVYKDNATAEFEEVTQFASEYPAAFNVSGNITATYPSNLTYNLTNGTTANVTSGHKTGEDSNIYVRVVLNEAVIPINGCSSGPGYSCPLDQFNNWVSERLSQIRPYDEFCGVPEGAPKHLDFFWNYNTTTDLDTSSDLSYQKGLVSWDDKPIEE